MITFHRSRLVLVLTALVAVPVSSPSAEAQRRVIGGGDNIDVSDDDDSDGDSDDNRRGRRRNSGDNSDDDNEDRSERQRNFSGNAVQQELQRMIQGRSGASRSRQSVRQQGQPSKNQPGNQQFDNLREFQEWSGRGPRGAADSRNRAAIKIGSWSSQFGNKTHPFSANWYKEHPDAWHHTQPQADIWVNVPAEGVTSWLGWGNSVPGSAQVVIPGRRHVHGGHFDPARYGDWLPLGVYMLMSSPDDNTRLVQLAVDRSGSLRGVYYDAITDQSYNVSGSMYRDAQEARWSLRTNRNVSFRARLSDLLSPYGRVRVYLPGGNQRWEIVRVER